MYSVLTLSPYTQSLHSVFISLLWVRMFFFARLKPYPQSYTHVFTLSPWVWEFTVPLGGKKMTAFPIQ